MIILSKEKRNELSPREALEILKEGNKRFIKNIKMNRDLLEQVNETAEGQYPFATILSCMDSRTTAELIFDQGLGDIFSIRIAGNIINDDILGSMEYACQVVESKLIVVMGHTNCGAVKGACDAFELGHLTPLLTKIRPAIYKEQSVAENRNSSNKTFVENVSALNVKNSMEAIMTRSIVLNNLIQQKKVGLVGAIYDVATASVKFIEDSYGF